MESQKLLQESGRRIVIRPARSRYIITLITSLHAAAMTLLFLSDLNSWLLLASAALIAIHLYHYLTIRNLSDHSLSLQQGESMLLNINNNSWSEIDVIESFVTNWLIVLRVRTVNDSSFHSLVYAVDSIDHYTFRQLRIYLNNFSTDS